MVILDGMPLPCDGKLYGWRLKARNEGEIQLSKYFILDSAPFSVFFVFADGNHGGGGGFSTHFLTGTCHFARKIGTNNSVNSGGL